MKPREFRSETIAARGRCGEEDGSKIVDTRIDLFDDRTTARELKRYAQWLLKAAAWLESKDS